MCAQASLQDLLGTEVALLAAEPMARHTSIRVGGPAEWYAVVRTAEQLRRAVAAAGTLGLAFTIIGGGANVLVSDRGIRGLVIENRARAIKQFPLDVEDGAQRLVRAESGVHMASLARTTARSGLVGMEWAAGIPGTAGGAVVSNAGAYGGCMNDVVCAVETCDRSGAQRRWTREALALGYRSSQLRKSAEGSVFQAQDIVLWVEIVLHEGDAAEAQARIAQYEQNRRAAQPPGPSAGSTFKNPPGDSAGRLIERAGLKGERQGAAQISPRHANFFVTRPGATAADVQTLIDRAQQAVLAQFGVRLEPEVLFLGEWD